MRLLMCFNHKINLFAAFGLTALLGAGCASHPPTSEKGILENVTQLTSGFNRAGEAYFSPQMDWIVFQASQHGEPGYQMYIAPLRWNTRDDAALSGHVYLTPLPMTRPVLPERTTIAGIGDPTRISPDQSKNTCGYFSPDENSLIFASTGDRLTSLTTQPTSPTSTATTAPAGYQRATGTYQWDFPPEMEIYRADGWEAAVQVAGPGGLVNLALHPLTHNHAYDAECAYSADGNWIVFTSNRSGDLELYAMHADGTHIVQLTHTRGYDGGAFFSPDGKRLVYRSDRAGNDLLQIYVATIVRDGDGQITGLKDERKLTRDQNVNWGPFWHPDGKHIIYASSAQGHQNYELYLMRVDGSHKVRITFSDGFDGLPAFSPDGKYLMWSSKRSADHTTQVFLARFKFPDGS
jgi:WD40 repeat protein